jgi:GT2 family glycosyltransferase
MRLLDIVIPTHKRPERLRTALAALHMQVESTADVRVIVVNDGTNSAEYEQVIARFSDLVSYVPLSASRGPAYARNQGARASEALYVAFLDDDCAAPVHWLNWLLALIDTMPHIDVFGGPTRPPAAPKGPKAIERFNRAFGFYPRPLYSGGEIFCLPSANVAVRRSIFLNAGGFDTAFRYAAGEDLNFFYQLKKSGYKFFIDEKLFVIHPVSDTPRAFVRRWYRYGYGTAQHRIKSDDARDYGLLPGTTYKSVLEELPRHIRYMRQRLEAGRGGDWLLPDPEVWPWERVAFSILAALRQTAYRIGGAHAFAREKGGECSVATDTGTLDRASST